MNSAFGSSVCETIVATCVAHSAKKPNVRVIVTAAPTVFVSTVAMRSTWKVPNGVFSVPCASTFDW